MLAYSMRDDAQLLENTQSKSRPRAVTYDREDRDPRRQDAAKIVVPANKVSLTNQVRFPMGTADGTITFVTWDAWFGSEFRFTKTGIGGYKTFQFASPKDRIWFEVRTRFRQDQARQARRQGKAPRGKGRLPDREEASDVIGMIDGRAYGARGKAALGPNVTRQAPLSPQVGSFTIRAETWTRYWVLIDQRANDWDLISLWAADENHDAVQIFDKLQFSVNGSVEAFWLEYNTSAHRSSQELGPRVAYARNLAILRNVQDVTSLLQRPVR